MSPSVALLWGLSCFAFGWLAHRWAYRPPRRVDPPIDLRATLAGDVRIEELRRACFEDARRKR